MKSFYVGLLVMVFMLGGVGCAGAEGGSPSPLVGKKAPDFTLDRVSGNSASLSEVIGGKRAVLFFFASWCPHCRTQVKQMAAKEAELEKEGVVLALVNIGESKNKVGEFLTSFGMKADSFLDEDSLVAETYQVLGVPTLFFIGADGKVRFVEYGLPENYKDILE